MSCDYIALASSGVQTLTPYTPGKPVEELERELGLNGIVKLASNENPLGPSEQVLLAIEKAAKDITRYPDGNGYHLKHALSERLGVTPETITLGNGSNDVLDLIARAFLAPGDEAIMSQYAFAVYPLSTQAVGATPILTPAKEWGHDLQAMANAVTDRTKLIFIANPNNPTGTGFNQGHWEHFIQQVPARVLVVLDEAYFEYVEQNQLDGLAYLEQFPNLIVTRTFSKAYGLASLRVGYGISNPDVANVLNRVRQPFNVNAFALAASVAALNDQAYLQKSRDINRQGMLQLEQGLTHLGLTFIPSAGNFIAVDFQQDGMDVYQLLLQQGVIVRPVSAYGMPSFLRVSVGLQDENTRFLEAVRSVQKS